MKQTCSSETERDRVDEALRFHFVLIDGPFIPGLVEGVDVALTKMPTGREIHTHISLEMLLELLLIQPTKSFEYILQH